MKSTITYIILGAVILVILAVILTQLPGSNDATVQLLNKLKIATGFTLLALIFLFGFAVLVSIANGTISLAGLLSESDNVKGASMSRFQLLIFTLVIGFSLFLVTIANGMQFPKIPPEILTLLGISGTTYAVSKGIQLGSNPTPNTTTTTPIDAAAQTAQSQPGSKGGPVGC
jgi:hypothetical protein